MEDTDEMMISVQKVKSLCYTINDSCDASTLNSNQEQGNHTLVQLRCSSASSHLMYVHKGINIKQAL